MNLLGGLSSVHQTPAESPCEQSVISSNLVEKGPIPLVHVTPHRLSRKRSGYRNIQDENRARLRQARVKTRKPVNAESPCRSVSKIGRSIPVAENEVCSLQGTDNRFCLLPTIQRVKHVKDSGGRSLFAREEGPDKASRTSRIHWETEN